MEFIFRICLFVAGIINLMPVVLAFFPTKIVNSYGIEVTNQNLELLIRHRAIMFGIIGGIMVHSAITKKNYFLASLIGFISMISFIILSQFVNGEINPELNKVLKIDIVGIIILGIGVVLYKFKK